LCIWAVLMCELLNTAIEKIIDHYSDYRHEDLEDIKDIAAWASMIISITAAIVWVLIIMRHVENGVRYFVG
jgi:diacylglycerol kinase